MIKILFVDDNFDCLKILERVFRKEFIVYTTSGVNAAMEILKNKKANLVCSDLHMRGETGVVLLQEMIRSDMNIPFILMSGDIDSMEIKRAESYGAVFLEKNGELASRIKRIAVSVEKKGSQAIGEMPACVKKY